MSDTGVVTELPPQIGAIYFHAFAVALDVLLIAHDGEYEGDVDDDQERSTAFFAWLKDLAGDDWPHLAQVFALEGAAAEIERRKAVDAGTHLQVVQP